MTDFEFDDDLEREIRMALRASIDPPAAPAAVREAVTDLARTRGRSGGRAGRFFAWPHASALMGLAAALAIASVIGLSVMARGNPSAGTPHGGGGSVYGSGSTLGAYGWAGGLVGWLASGTIIRITTDGGATWFAPRTAPVDGEVQFVDALHGWTEAITTTGGSSTVTVYRTSDGGLTWQSASAGTVPLPSGTELAASMHFADARHGIVLASATLIPQNPSPSTPPDRAGCRLYATDDGGATWAERPGAPCNTFIGPSFPTPLVGYLATDPVGSLSVTVDGGRTWKTAYLPDAVAPRQIWVRTMEADGAGVLHLLVMEMQDGVSVAPVPIVVLESRDGGASWSEEFRAPTPNGNILGQVSRVGPGHWIAFQESTDPAAQSGADQLIETKDGGRTWAIIPSSGFTMAGDITFGDAQHGILQGILTDCPPQNVPVSSPSDCGGNGQLFHTTDGHTWQVLAP